MTTPSTERKAGPLLGTGAQTTWPFTFKVFAATDIAVTIADTLGVEMALVYGVDYNVTLNANQETSPGGTVTYPISGAALPVGKRLVIFGNLPYDQPLDLPSGGNFSPLALENQLDRMVMQIQQLRENVGRALQVSVSTNTDVTLPPPAASQLIGWDATGENLENVPLSELGTAIAYGTYRYDTFTGDGTTTNFALSEDPAVLANLDVSISGVVQVPGTDYSLVTGNLVFASAPLNGTTILARYGQALTALPDSDQITFVQAGPGAATRTVQNKLRETISVKDFGAAGDGVTDDTLAIQAAINYVESLQNRPTIVLPVGKYKITDTIEIKQDCISLFGLGMPSLGRGDDSSSITRGATLRYYGTGTALRIGRAPDVNGTFIYNTTIQNLRIEVDNNTSCAMRVWHSLQGYFKNIGIFGNKGNAIGLFVNAGVSNIYEQIVVTGLGQTPGLNNSEYLGNGMRLTLGYLNDLATTTVFRRCYITYCNIGVEMNYRYDFEDTVFESCDVGVASLSYMVSNFQRCWWEANITLDIYFAGGADGDTALINNSLINSYTRQTFFATGNGAQQITIDGCQIVTSNANPQLFGGGANIVKTSSPQGRLTLSNNRLSTNTILGGLQRNAGSSFPLVQNKDQKLVVYRFVQKSITPGFATDMDTGDAIAGKAFFMPSRGNVVGVNLWYSGALGGGDFNIATKINATSIEDLSSPQVPAMTTEPQLRMCDPMKYEVAAGDALTFYLGINGFSGGDFVAEVYVLHGSSGRP